MKKFESLNDSKFAKFEGNTVSNLHAAKGGMITTLSGGSVYADKCTQTATSDCSYTEKGDRGAQQ
jgi:hypothetical protein